MNNIYAYHLTRKVRHCMMLTGVVQLMSRTSKGTQNLATAQFISC